MMQADTIKLVFTYTIAFVVIVGGGLMLYLTRLDPSDSGSANLQLLLSGFIGAAITFVFNAEAGTRATRAANASVAAGAAASGTNTGSGA